MGISKVIMPLSSSDSRMNTLFHNVKHILCDIAQIMNTSCVRDLMHSCVWHDSHYEHIMCDMMCCVMWVMLSCKTFSVGHDSHYSHVKHTNESCHTFEWVMSHIRKSYVTPTSKSCHTNESCHTYKWVMSHIWMSHVIRVDESWLTSHHKGAKHCNIPATHCNTLQHTAAHCNTLAHTATHCNKLRHTATHCDTLQHNATHCNTMQHNATQCNTPQHAIYQPSWRGAADDKESESNWE